MIGRDAAASFKSRIVPFLHAYEHPHARRSQRLRTDASVLQRAPGLLQKQALTRVHRFRFRWRQLKEQRIELRDPWYQPAPQIGSSLCLSCPFVLQAIERDPLDDVASLRQNLPQRLHIACLRESATHPNDGDRLQQTGRSASLGNRRNRLFPGLLWLCLAALLIPYHRDRGRLVERCHLVAKLVKKTGP